MKKYSLYKETDVKGIPSIPKGWVINKIKFVSKTIAGGTPDTKNIQFWENGTIPWLPSGKVHDCNIYDEDADTFITELGLKGSAAKLIPANSILIALTGATCANIAHLHFVATANQSVVAMPGSKKIENRFLFYCLLGIREQILINKTGGAQSGINDGDIKNTKIPYPHLSEQQAIVRFLDYKTGQIDSFIANRQKQIELLKEQKAGIINKAVTKGINPKAKMKDSGIEWIGDVPEHWEIWKTKFLCKRVSTGNTPSSNELKYYDNGSINWFTPGDFKEEFKMVNSQRKVTDIAIEEKECKLFSAYSTYVIGIGATLGKVRMSETTASANQQINVLEFNEKVLPEFGFYYFYSIEKTIIANANLSTMGIINQTKMKNLEMPLPPKVEQEAILNYINIENLAFDSLISKYQKQIDLMQEYRTSLISQAVTGKIDVREWQPKKQQTA
jgi:type I restriction enzyme S subunit